MWFLSFVAIVVGVPIALWIGSGVYEVFIEPRVHKHQLKTGKRKSDAYIEGYKDMLVAVGLPKTYKKRVPDTSYYSARYTKQVDQTTVELNKNRIPSYYNEEGLKRVASQILYEGMEINPASGRIDVGYLGGTEQEFQDYYAGGMKLLGDIDEAKAKVLQGKADATEKARLIESRRQGMKAIDRKIVADMKALDELRTKTFSQTWEEQMKEIAS